MREPMKIGDLYMESYFSADDLMRNTIAVCDSAQFNWTPSESKSPGRRYADWSAEAGR